MVDHDDLKFRASKGSKIGVWIGISVLLVLDQLTKFIIVRYLPLHESIPVIRNFFDITHIRNTGIAFGLFSSEPTKFKAIIMGVLTFLSLILIVYLLYRIKSSSRLFTIGLSSVLAGAFGNLIDRIFRGGGVVDFVDVHWYNLHWPAFNVADSAISIGVVLLLIDTFFAKEKIPDESN